MARRSALSHYENGVEFMRMEDWAAATRAFRRAVEIDPNLAEAYAGLGAALGNQGLWSLCIEAHRRALTLVPDHVDTLYNLGVAFGELGRPAEAVRYFRQVLAARPRDPETMVRLGTELAEQGQFAEALEHFMPVAVAEPPNAFAATAWAYTGLALMGMARMALYHHHCQDPVIFRTLGDIRKKALQDLACGDGFYTRRFRTECGANPVMGIDVSPKQIERAEAIEQREQRGIEYRIGDVRSLDLDRQFDIQVSLRGERMREGDRFAHGKDSYASFD